MAIPRFVYMALGAAAVDLLGGKGKGFGGKSMGGRGLSALGKQVDLHDVAVRITAAGLRAADAVSSFTQSVADEAADINVEAHRQARIDAAVRERVAEVEKDIRAEVIAEFDEDDPSFDYDE